ncbi:hypothetical protein TNCV_927461 [Trichonephila clavipes]|nr:hypothetical protein TNCV_927461 [Trichonephila clavipes]
MPKEVEELVFVWASRLRPYPWVRFDYPFPFVIRSKNRGELQCLLKQVPSNGEAVTRLGVWSGSRMFLNPSIHEIPTYPTYPFIRRPRDILVDPDFN